MRKLVAEWFVKMKNIFFLLDWRKSSWSLRHFSWLFSWNFIHLLSSFCVILWQRWVMKFRDFCRHIVKWINLSLKPVEHLSLWLLEIFGSGFWIFIEGLGSFSVKCWCFWVKKCIEIENIVIRKLLQSMKAFIDFMLFISWRNDSSKILLHKRQVTQTTIYQPFTPEIQVFAWYESAQ